MTGAMPAPSGAGLPAELDEPIEFIPLSVRNRYSRVAQPMRTPPQLMVLERRVVAMGRVGAPRQEIADACGCRPDTVAKYLRRHGIVTPHNAPSRQERHWQAVVEWDFAQGKSAAYTAARTGMSESMVLTRRRRAGLIAPKPPKLQRVPHATLLAERRAHVRMRTEAGWSVARICDELGLTERQVLLDRRRAGCVHLFTAAPIVIDAADNDAILSMLEDGAGYAETGRTLGFDADLLKRRYPGFGLPVGEGSRRWRMERWFEAIPADASAIGTPTPKPDTHRFVTLKGPRN